MICNECETVAHCAKHGCIPKQPAEQEPVAIIASLMPAERHTLLEEGHSLHDSLYASPPAQRTWVGLTDEQLDKAAMKLAECMDYPWEQMPEEGKRNMRDHAKAIIEAAHGIKENT